MKKILFSHSLLAKNESALNGSKLTLASRLLYMSTEVANRAERVKRPARDACLYMGEATLPDHHFLFAIASQP